jgi:hypothetical protein
MFSVSNPYYMYSTFLITQKTFVSAIFSLTKKTLLVYCFGLIEHDGIKWNEAV